MENLTFDALFTKSDLQMLKVLLPCLPADKRGFLAVYIKYRELSIAMELLQNPGTAILEKLTAPSSPEELLNSLERTDCAHNAEFEKMRSILQQLSSMQEMLGMMETLQALFPDGFDGDISDLAGILGADKKQKDDPES